MNQTFQRAGLYSFLTMLLLLVSVPANAQESEDNVLKYRFQKGLSTREVVNRTTLLKGKLPGSGRAGDILGKVTVKAIESINTVSRVDQVNEEGVATLKMKISGYSLRFRSFLQNISYNSNSGGTFADAFNKIINRAFTIRMSPLGEIKEITELSSYLQKAKEELPDTRTANFVATLLTLKNIKGLLKPAWIQLPDAAVSKGSQWNDTWKGSPLPRFKAAEATVQLTHKKDIKRGKKTIAGLQNNGTLGYPGKRKAANFKQNNADQPNGETYVHRGTGLVLRSNFNIVDTYVLTNSKKNKEGKYTLTLKVQRKIVSEGGKKKKSGDK